MKLRGPVSNARFDTMHDAAADRCGSAKYGYISSSFRASDLLAKDVDVVKRHRDLQLPHATERDFKADVFRR